MKKILILIIVVLASALYFHDELKQIISPPEVKIVKVDIKELVGRDGLMYQKFSEIPFTGKVTGEQKGAFKNGKRDGEWFWYYSTGQLMQKRNWKNEKKEGEWVLYYDDGQLRQKGNYENGMSEGEWVYYYGNRKLQMKGNYKDGKQEGDWVGYSYNGTVWKEMTGTFKNGKKIGE